jgi:ACS family hexuronate transporter-like MFS transporter
MGTLVTTVGYTPFFVGLAVLDLLGAVILWSVVREPEGVGTATPAPAPSAATTAA